MQVSKIVAKITQEMQKLAKWPGKSYEFSSIVAMMGDELKLKLKGSEIYLSTDKSEAFHSKSLIVHRYKSIEVP